jgi:hypothetical protein
LTQLETDPGATCAQICRALCAANPTRKFPSASVSSQLTKMINAGQLAREPRGPRGGYGYFLMRDKEINDGLHVHLAAR